MQKPSYRRLREEDRQVIYRMSKAGKTQQEIAQALGLSQSTVSKELWRVIVVKEATVPNKPKERLLSVKLLRKKEVG